MALARLAVTCVTLTSMLPRASDPLPPKGRTSSLRLPGAVLQGILARAALAFLRVYLGLLFLYASIPQLRGGFAVDLSGFLNDVALIKSAEFYREFLHAVVLPNAPLFARLIPWGELLVGVSLLLGLATRLSAAGALLLLVNYMLAKGAWFWYPSSNDAALAAIAVAIIVGAAGRTFGVDAVLARRWPRSPLW
jgi:thiosulfate dehydrogenase (quinone) large subunit